MATLFDSASLVMIPSGYKDDKLYSIKPTDGSGDFTFSRDGAGASPATRVNASGYIEKGRENLLIQSNSFTTGWSFTSGSSLTGGQTGYDGSSDAWLLTDSGNNSAYALYRGYTNTGVQTFSIYAKQNTTSQIEFDFLGGGGGYLRVELTDGSLHSTNNTIDYNIEDVGSGWYRCSFAVNHTSAPTLVRIGCNGAGSIFIQDAQVELGLIATDVIETTTAPVSAGLLGDMPRLDYSGGATCPSLLLEPSRVNLVPHSEYFGAWNKSTAGITITQNYGISPEGVKNSSRVQFTGASQHINISTSLGVGVTSTGSVYIKGTAGETIQFDTGGAGALRTLTGEWQRIEVTSTSVSSLLLINTFNGATARDIEVYGAQLEQGSYATSYIPTYGSASTRGVDVCDLDGMNTAGISTSNNWTYFIDVNDFESGTNGFYLYTTSGEILHLFSSSIGYRNTTNSTEYIASWSWSPYNGNNTRIKMIFRYDGSTLSVFINGSKKDDVSSSSLNAKFNDPFNRDRFHWAGLSKWDTNQKLFFNTSLTDAECIALTTL